MTGCTLHVQFLKATLKAWTCLHMLTLAALYNRQALSADTVCPDTSLLSRRSGERGMHTWLFS